ncbi:unnamed protein product [Lactuca saligna]|uniref:CBS domain-containing protein n=1 Tax=Lactuca saligna TaxID=75948 RepID=A0AA35V4T5_LACSI|nr:unnamed protein product [Lactuca saligna]
MNLSNARPLSAPLVNLSGLINYEEECLPLKGPIHSVIGNSDDRTNNGLIQFIRSKKVKELHLSEALIVPETTSIYEACCQMAAQRADVLVLTNSDAFLSGLLTKKDIATRVSAHEIDLVNTPVSKVMTENPFFVLSDTLVEEALNYMAKEQFKQLPVVENDKVIGLLDLLLSLFDETANTETTVENYDKVVEATVQRVTQRALTVVELPPDYAMIIPETETIYDACCEMIKHRNDAVVLTGSNVIFSGILTKKDIVTRIIPCGIDIVNTPVSKVMSKKPIFVSYDSLPEHIFPEIVLQGQGTHLLVRENNEDGGFIYHSLSIQGGVLPNTRTTNTKHKFPDAPQHTSVDPSEQSSKPLQGVNGNVDCYETDGPGLTPFVHVSNSPYPDVDPYDKLVVPTVVPRHPKQSSEPLSSVNGNGEWDETDGPGLTPFVHVSNSPYPNVDPNEIFSDLTNPEESSEPFPGVIINEESEESHGPGLTPYSRINNSPYPNDQSFDKLMAPPPQHTDVRPPEQSSDPPPGVNSNDEWDETDGPGFTPFSQVTNSPYPNDSCENLVDPSQQNTTVHPSDKSRNPLPSVSENVPWDGTDGPDIALSAQATIAPNLNNLLHDLVPPQPQANLGSLDESSNLLQAVNGKGDDKKNKKPSINMWVSIVEKTVEQMGISEALIVSPSITIYEACYQMSAHRANVLVVTDLNGLPTGILTYKDIVKTVIASEIHLVNTPISKVMSKNPSCVMSDTLFVNALKEMEDKSFKQLPVTQKNGKVIGLFYNMGMSDLTKFEKVIEAAARGFSPRGLKMKQMPLQHALMVPGTTTIYEACCRMAAGKFEVVVLTNIHGFLMGILTKKDIVTQVIPNAIDIQKTSVSKVMKKNRIWVSCDSLPVETMEDIVRSVCLDFLVIENGEDNELLYLPLDGCFPY